MTRLNLPPKLQALVGAQQTSVSISTDKALSSIVCLGFFAVCWDPPGAFGLTKIFLHQEVCSALDVTLPTVLKTRRRLAEGGLQAAARRAASAGPQTQAQCHFAAVCKEIDRMFPAAHTITLVCDNLNTHTMGALYASFPAEEARRLARKIQIKHTPKHGSWLNIAELEFAVLGRGVFKKRIADPEQLQRELDAVCAERNAVAVPVRWQFNLSRARQKMAWAYPKVPNESS